MKPKHAPSASLALLIGAGLVGSNLASATPITFVESVTGGGVLGAMRFSNSLITVTATGDTSNLSGSGNFLSLTGTAVTINIASLGVTATLTDTSNVFVCHNCGEGSFGITDDTVSKQPDILDIYGSAVKPYDLTTSFGPVTTTMPGVNDLASFNTNEGQFSITSLTGTDPSITFYAILEIQPVAAFLDQFDAPALTFNGSTNFPDAGGLLIGAPGVTEDPNGNVYVVGLDAAGGVHLNSYNGAGSVWNGWQYSGGILDTSSGLTAAVAPSGVVWFTGRDIGNRYWINSWNGTTFGGWILVADGIFSSDSIPQIAIPSDGTIYVIGKDTGGRIWSNSYNPASKSFTGWVDRQAVMIGQPSATAGQDGLVYVAVRSVASNSPVYITQIPASNAATANTWLNGGGEIDTDPQIASQGGTVYLTAEAGGNTVYLLTFTESNQMFGTWSFTNGILNDSTIAAAAGNVFIAGRDSENRIYWYSQTGNNWFIAGGAGVSSTALTGAK